MTPAARAQAAIELIDAWNGGLAIEQALLRWARGARYAGAKDRRAVRDLVFDVLRRRGSCAARGGAETGRALLLGHLRRNALSPEEIFAGDGYGPAALTSDEVLRGDEPAPFADIPHWLHAPMREALGGEFSEIAQAICARAPLYLRVNARRGSVKATMAALDAEAIQAVPEEACATALRVTEGARKVASSKPYHDGLVEIQDLSAQMACASVNWPQGGVLDYCAGGGGKALAIAAATGGSVDVHDAAPGRMADLPARAMRAGAQLVQRPSPKGPYRCVLVDVPCSGSGTWRRNPEAKWRLSPEKLLDYMRLQEDILDRAAGLVAGGGQLVYMTCSLLASENSDQIESFLRRQIGWSHRQSRLFTPLNASDGFFVAELRREADI